MPPLSILIKPASGGCNMRCAYCFYHDEAMNRAVPSYGMMSEDTLETLIRKALDYASGQCTFGFQGGEPTLRGLEFFRLAVEYQQKYNVHNVRINNALQTNGLVLDGSWARFFKENGFLIGLSLDGGKALHDSLRRDSQGRGTFSRTLRAARLLQSHEVDFNLLTVVTRQVAENITQVYRFFRREGMLYQQYIPCLDPLGEPRGGSDYSLTPEIFGKFLKSLFDLWYQGVKADGSVYPCDFYCLDEWKQGNILQDDFTALDKCEAAQKFLRESIALPEDCKDCQYRFICRGGCRRDRELLSAAADTPRRNYFCQAYKVFFPYALPRLRELIGL